jgi:NADH dehydrogenase (ubiquinone) 1 beta subcomplex subunit 3
MIDTSRDTAFATYSCVHSEQWRYTGPFTRFQRFKGSFPGLGIATVAFGAYLAAEQFGLIGDAHAHHDEAASEHH